MSSRRGAAEMVARTLHSDGQRGPCPCGSGRRFVDCHLPRAVRGVPVRVGGGVRWVLSGGGLCGGASM